MHDLDGVWNKVVLVSASTFRVWSKGRFDSLKARDVFHPDQLVLYISGEFIVLHKKVEHAVVGHVVGQSSGGLIKSQLHHKQERPATALRPVHALRQVRQTTHSTAARQITTILSDMEIPALGGLFAYHFAIGFRELAYFEKTLELFEQMNR